MTPIVKMMTKLALLKSCKIYSTVVLKIIMLCMFVDVKDTMYLWVGNIAVEPYSLFHL